MVLSWRRWKAGVWPNLQPADVTEIGLINTELYESDRSQTAQQTEASCGDFQNKSRGYHMSLGKIVQVHNSTKVFQSNLIGQINKKEINRIMFYYNLLL